MMAKEFEEFPFVLYCFHFAQNSHLLKIGSYDMKLDDLQLTCPVSDQNSKRVNVNFSLYFCPV